MTGRDQKTYSDPQNICEPLQDGKPHQSSARQTRSRSPARYSIQNSYRDRPSQQQHSARRHNRPWRTRPLLNDIGSLFRVDLEQRDPDQTARSFRIVPTTYDGGCRINTVGQTLNGATKVAIIHNRESLMAWADRMAASLEERGPGGELTIISALGDMHKQRGKGTVVERWDGSGLFCAPPSTAGPQPTTIAQRPDPVVRMPPTSFRSLSSTDASKHVPTTNLIPVSDWHLCQNCSGLGHHPADCVVPRPSGFTHICPLCGTSGHLVDKCSQWYEKTIWQRMDILVRNRAGKPPLATAERSWPNMVVDTKDRSRYNAPSDWVEITEFPLDYQMVQRIINMPDCPRAVWMSHDRFSAHLARIGARSFYTPQSLNSYRPDDDEQVCRSRNI